MIRFPITLYQEKDLNLKLLRELLMIFARNLVINEGDYLDATINLEAEILLTLHDGQIAKGSRVSINLQKEKVFVKLMEV